MPKVSGKSLNILKAGGNVLPVCSPYFNKRGNASHNLELPYGRNTLANMLSSDYHLMKNKRKSREFFNQDCQDLAKSLLGQCIVHQVKGARLSGFIVETECYLGHNDVASHSYNGKRTPRNEPMFMAAGTSYVYSIYGMYHCFNISSKEDGSCVLIRALEPYENLQEMTFHRQERLKNTSKPKQLKHKELCNGPSKLCQALNITKECCNKIDMVNSEVFWVEEGINIEEMDIITSRRIGIKSAGEEWANKPLRYYILDNSCVSVRDKKSEELKMKSVT